MEPTGMPKKAMLAGTPTDDTEYPARYCAPDSKLAGLHIALPPMTNHPEVVLVGDGALLYAPWMYETVFSGHHRGPDEKSVGAYAVSPSSTLLTLPEDFGEKCLGEAMGLSLYPAYVERADKPWQCQMKRNDFITTDDSDCDTATDDQHAKTTFTVGVLERGTETWSARHIYFFPVVPARERAWPTVPSPALFIGMARMINSAVIAAGDSLGTHCMACPVFLTSHVTPSAGGRDAFMAKRGREGGLYDPMMDPLGQVSSAVKRGVLHGHPFGAGDIHGSNNFQAGVGIVFPEDYTGDKRGEAERLIREAAQKFWNLPQGEMVVHIKRGLVTRRVTFSTIPAFTFQSSFLPRVSDLRVARNDYID